MRVGLIAFVLAVSVAPGCRKPPNAAAKSDQAPPTAEATPTQAGPDPETEFAEVRARILPTVKARVPVGLADKLKFAPQFDARSRVVALVPESWVMDNVPGKLRPPPDADLGASTSIAFGAGCNGRCAPKDWAKAFDDVEVRTLPLQHIDSDEPIGKSGRIVVVSAGDVRYVVAGLWKPDGARYFYCRATLEGNAIAALPAFVTACRGMDVRRWE